MGRFFGDDRAEGNILHSTPQCEENSKHRIERHIGGPGFDLGNAWLARLQLLGYLNLRQVLSYAVLAHGAADCNPQFDKTTLFDGELEEVFGIPENPSSRFQSLLFISIHEIII